MKCKAPVKYRKPQSRQCRRSAVVDGYCLQHAGLTVRGGVPKARRPLWYGTVRGMPILSDLSDCAADERGTHETKWGEVLQIQVAARNGRRLTWDEVHLVFSVIYPGRWALQVFPPHEQTVDNVNAYHLWVLPPGVRPPFGIDEDARNLNTGMLGDKSFAVESAP